jgi:hypothetical protein
MAIQATEFDYPLKVFLRLSELMTPGTAIALKTSAFVRSGRWVVTR